MDVVMVMDTGIHGDNPMGGGQYARMELVRHLRSQVPAHYCFVTHRHSLLSEIARDIYDEVKIVDYVFFRQRRHHLSLGLPGLCRLWELMRKASQRLQETMAAVQDAVRPRGMVIMPNENYSRMAFARLQTFSNRRYRALTIIDNEFNRGFRDKGVVCIYSWVFSRLLAASQAAGRPFRYTAPSKLRIIYPGVDILGIRRQAQLDPCDTRDRGGNGHFNVFFSGSLVDIKRPDFALQVFARFLRDAPVPATLQICGDGPMGTKLRELTESLNLREGRDVFFLGHLEHSQYLQLLARKADVLVHPSLTEAFPRVVVEAQALRVPVIVSRTGGMMEVVDHRYTGFLVDPADMQGFVNCLQFIAGDAALRQSLGRCAYRYSERFDVTRALAAYTKIFEEMLAA